MNNKKLIGIALLGILSLGASQVQGAVLEKNYIGSTYGFTKLQNMPAGQDDELHMFGVVARYGDLENLDIVGASSFGSLNGTDFIATSFGVQPYLPLGSDKLKVFGDFQILWGSLDNGFSSDDDFGYSVGGGAELDLTETLSIAGLATYHDLFNEDDITVSAAVFFWITEKVMIEGGAGYALDREQLSVNAGVAIGF